MANKLNTQKLSTTNVIILGVVVGVIVVILTVAVGRILLKQITHNARVITKKQVADKRLQQNLTNLPILAQAYNSLGSTQGTINDALPVEASFPSLVATLEAISGASGVGLQSVSPANTASTAVPDEAEPNTPQAAVDSINGTTSTPSSSSNNTPTPQSLNFTVVAQGPYPAVLAFLKNLQLSARPIKVTSMQLTGTTPVLTATISATTYYFDPQVLIDKTEAVK